MSARVLITDGEQRAALAVVRSLGHAGHDCVVTATRVRSLAGASRHCRATIETPDPLHEPSAFTARIAEVVRTRRIDLIIPISDPALLALLPHQAEFAPACIPFPNLQTVTAVADKARVARAAAAAGIAVPRQVEADRVEVVRQVAGTEVAFPLVLKPVRSVAGRAEERIKVGVRHASTPAVLEEALQGIPEAAYPVLVQERIVGPGIGQFLLLWEHQLRAAFAHRRLREKPPSGGVSVYRESIPVDQTLLARSRALLDAFGWHGVAMVEYKVQASTGQPFLMEINGRFWGSLQLAIDAGVDFPRMLADLALGRDPGPAPVPRLGVRSRWWWGDVDHLVARLRHSREACGLPADAPGRLRAALNVLVPWRPGARSEILRFDDPAPFVRETLDWFRGY